MAGVHVTGNYPLSISKDIDTMFANEYARATEEWPQLLHKHSMDEAYMTEAEIAGLYSALEMYEGQPITFDTMTEGNYKRINPVNWGLGVQITENAMQDDRQGKLKLIGPELARAMTVAKELRAFDLFNSGFVTTQRTGIDSKALFADDHPLIATGTSTSTIDNKSAITLSYSSLQVGMDHFENLVDEKGLPIPGKPDLLITGPTNRWMAERLCKNEYNPDNANRELNLVGNKGLQYVIVHWLTSTTSWFLMDSKRHDLRFIWRRQPKVETQTDFNTGNLMKKVTARFVTDFVRYRYVWGSTGA